MRTYGEVATGLDGPVLSVRDTGVGFPAEYADQREYRAKVVSPLRTGTAGSVGTVDRGAARADEHRVYRCRDDHPRHHELLELSRNGDGGR